MRSQLYGTLGSTFEVDVVRVGDVYQTKHFIVYKENEIVGVEWQPLLCGRKRQTKSA